MKLNLDIYKDKLFACWIGKNIGGTMGTPYEGKREFLDIQGFITDKNVVLPNDDLDLQLVWLRAIESFGASGVNRQRLGELWLSYITPHWKEYGIAKSNMKKGLYPPLCGDAFTTWKDSNGAWIRTEIWACLAPGAVDVAARYAYDDACIDHGALGEGTIAAVFIAAMQSAAFYIRDIRELIDIGLACIPQNSRVAKSIRQVIECFEGGKDYKTTRNIILEMNMDIGDGWFEAPSNVAYVVIGLLFGQGDFKKSMIYAINCGDDTDCTGATVGAILGIMGGTKAIPQDWQEHIGDAITTMSISLGVLWGIPKTCTELTERVYKAMPEMLYSNHINIEFVDDPMEGMAAISELNFNMEDILKLFEQPTYSYTLDFMHTTATVIYPSEPKIEPLQTMKVKIRFGQIEANSGGYCGAPYYLNFRCWEPDGFVVKCPPCVLMNQRNEHTSGNSEIEIEITAPEKIKAINRLVLETVADEKMTIGYIPITLLG